MAEGSLGFLGTNQPGRAPFDREKLQIILVVVTALAIGASLVAEHIGAPSWLILAINLISYAAGGLFGLEEGIKSLRRRELNVDLLMILAALGAATVGAWTEGATLLFLFSLSNVLQNYAMDRSRNAIKALLKLRPESALVQRDGQLVTVATEQLVVGDVILIKPGERLPVDGRVVAGSSAIDQSSITGESMPVNKEIGDDVFAGTVNQTGTLDVQMTRPASETTLARIIVMVEEAQGRRAETQQFMDDFEQKYAMLVIASVVLFIIIPPLLPNGPRFSSNFYTAMVLLTVLSPCALVISTPASILSAIANAARRGILFKGGAYLEEMATIKAIAFDKTGTITYGKPKVTDVIPYQGVDEDTLLAQTASVESKSEHPIAQAVVHAAHERKLDIRDPDTFDAVPGKGVQASLDGITLLVGTERLAEQAGYPVPPDLTSIRLRLESEGKTVLLVRGAQWLGAIGVADEIRPNAAEIFKTLREAGIEHISILTGDNRRVGEAVGTAVGADEVFAELLPEHKVDAIRTLQAKYKKVAMVGDGVNDAPGLAEANIGIAMGAAGTDVALETADVILMSDDLTSIAYAIKLSHRARRTVIQNISFSLTVVFVLVITTLGLNPLFPGQALPLPLGVIGHEGSTLLVCLNGILLLIVTDESLGLVRTRLRAPSS